MISSGYNTKDSMGNKYQETHADEITVLACNQMIAEGAQQHSYLNETP